jgi:hypothetical protein
VQEGTVWIFGPDPNLTRGPIRATTSTLGICVLVRAAGVRAALGRLASIGRSWHCLACDACLPARGCV